MAQGPLTGAREGVSGGFRQGLGDVLGLAAVAVRGGDQFAGDLVGDGGTEVPADDVEAQVDAGGHAGGGEQGAVVDVQDVVVHPEPRVQPFQLVGACPVRGHRTAVEQPGRGAKRPSAGASIWH